MADHLSHNCCRASVQVPTGQLLTYHCWHCRRLSYKHCTLPDVSVVSVSLEYSVEALPVWPLYADDWPVTNTFNSVLVGWMTRRASVCKNLLCKNLDYSKLRSYRLVHLTRLNQSKSVIWTNKPHKKQERQGNHRLYFAHAVHSHHPRLADRWCSLSSTCWRKTEPRM